MRWAIPMVLALQLPSGASTPDASEAREAREARRAAIELMNAGVERHARDDRFEAERAIWGAVAHDPSFWPAHVNLGRLLLEQGGYDEAKQEFETGLRLLEADPDAGALAASRAEIHDDLGRLHLAQAHLHAGRNRREHEAALRRAATAFEAATRTEHPDPRSFHDLGLVLDALDDPIAADHSYRACIELRPDYGPCYADLARMYFDYGDSNHAFAILETATKAIETGPEPRFALADFLVELRKPKSAIEAALETQRIDPEFSEILFPLGVAYADVGKIEEAIDTLSLYLARGSPNRYYERKEIAAKLAGRLSDSQ